MSERPHQRDGSPPITVNCNVEAGSVAGAFSAEARRLGRGSRCVVDGLGWFAVGVVVVTVGVIPIFAAIVAVIFFALLAPWWAWLVVGAVVLVTLCHVLGKEGVSPAENDEDHA